MLPTFLRRFRHSAEILRREGIGAVLDKVLRTLKGEARNYRRARRREDARFDAQFGTDTGGVDHLYALEVVGANREAGTFHLAAPEDEFERALNLVDLPLTDFTFVDFGSGKGKALMLAGKRGFRRLVGVEFATALHRIAEANFASRRAAGVKERVILLNEDVTTFAYPREPLLLYLFNPFGPPVIDAVAVQALAAARAGSRPMRVLYMNALHMDAFANAGWKLLRHELGAALFAPPEGDQFAE